MFNLYGVLITLSDGNIITSTSNHPFWEIASQEWLEAGELTNRSILLNINDENTTIKLLKHYSEKREVYNLTVGNIHTYYVGFGGVLGHNSTAGCPIILVNNLPNNVEIAYQKYKNEGWNGRLSEYTGRTSGGRVFRNNAGTLPTDITYREFDVNNHILGKNRDAERFVQGSNHKIYYTNDHYETFKMIVD